MARLLSAREAVRVALNLRVAFGRPDAPGSNVVVDIKGADPDLAQDDAATRDPVPR